MEGCGHKPRNTKDGWPPPGVGRGRKMLLEASEGTGPADPLISGFCLQNCETIEFCCPSPHFWHLVIQPQDTHTEHREDRHADSGDLCGVAKSITATGCPSSWTLGVRFPWSSGTQGVGTSAPVIKNRSLGCSHLSRELLLKCRVIYFSQLLVHFPFPRTPT